MKKRVLSLLLCALLIVSALSSCSHTHKYADEWSTSAEMHWKQDTCGHDTKAEEGYHSFELQGGTYVCTVCGYSKADNVLSVAQAVKSAPEGQEIVVEGLFVGISDEGNALAKELLLKDTASDQLIAVQGVSYGAFPNYGYERGDLVRLCGKVVRERYAEGDNATQNKTYLAFSQSNPKSIADTIVSRGNRVSYTFADAVQIESWDAMKGFFQASKVEAYTYVHIKGDVWFNTYAKAADGVVLHRFSMSSAAVNLSKMKPDGTRAVALRQNMLEANVPTAMTTYFDEILGSTSYPGKKGTVDFYAVVTATNSVNYQLTILDPSWMLGDDESIQISTEQDIVREMGFAYYRQGTQIYYDQRYRDENCTPEAASAQRRLFLDCSSFVNAVYYEAFGENVMDVPLSVKTCQTGNYANYAKENNGTKADVIGYWETANYLTTTQQKELLSQVEAMLQVGDVLNYRHGKSGPTSGHALLYIGDGMFLHSTGGQATYDSSKPSSNMDICNVMEMTHGTVQKIALSELFHNTASNRYLFRKTNSDTMYNFCVLRPLNRGLTPTQKTQNRMKIAGLSMEKAVSCGLSAAVVCGSEITYTLTVQNHSANSYTGVSFEDVLPDQLSFVRASAGVTANGQRVSATISVGAMERVVISWTARVKDGAAVGTRMESNATSLGGVTLPATVNFVGAYTEAQLGEICEKARDWALLEKSFDDPLALAEALYGADLFEAATAAELMAALLPVTDGAASFDATAEGADMAVPYLYNGTLVPRLATDIISLHAESDLAKGDLILCQWSGKHCLYVYIGNGQLVQVSTANKNAALVENGEEFCHYDEVAEKYCISSTISQLRTFELCVVLRPSIKG
ncbi:MAG: DUF11 domain-containing protein [Clostridia bacterium]|nr:DUF11 domain-containing protein [Clostridia bacterium]